MNTIGEDLNMLHSIRTPARPVVDSEIGGTRADAGIEERVDLIEKDRVAETGGIASRPARRYNALAFEIVGKVTSVDVERLAREIERTHEEHGKVRLLIRLNGFPQIEAPALLEKLKLLKVLPWIERYAVIGPDWMEFEVKAIAPIVGFEIRHFGIFDDEEAEEWLYSE